MPGYSWPVTGNTAPHLFVLQSHHAHFPSLRTGIVCKMCMLRICVLQKEDTTYLSVSAWRCSSGCTSGSWATGSCCKGIFLTLKNST